MKKLIVIIPFLLLIACLSQAQENKISSPVIHESTEEFVFRLVDEMPVYEGDINVFLAEHIRYPKEAIEKGIEGRVFIEFIIEKDGSVSHAKILRDVGGGCGEEAMRVVQLLKFKKAGMQNGKPVRMYYSLPVTFKLMDKEEKKESNMDESEDEVCLNVDEMPVYEGDIGRFISQKLRYPAMARSNKIQGNVYLSFIIEKDGSVSNVKITKDIGSGCGEEAIRVVSMLKFKKPGMRKGRPVRMLYSLSVAFNLK